MGCKFIFLAFLLCWMIVSGYAQDKSDIISQWKESVSVDGNLDEWNADGFLYDEETRLWYKLANDDIFLYLAIKKLDYPQKIFNGGGLSFTLNTAGQNSRLNSCQITFPKSSFNGRNLLDSELTTMEIRGFNTIHEVELNIYNEHGIQIGWSKGEGNGNYPFSYLYELAIPLSLIAVKNESTVNFNLLLRGFRQIPLAEAGGRSQPLTREHLRAANPNLTFEQMDALIIDRNDNDDWTEFWGTYRLASNPRQ